MTGLAVISVISVAAGMTEVGSFAQVHHIQPTEGGAMLLLLGHRRLRRTKTVSFLLSPLTTNPPPPPTMGFSGISLAYGPSMDP